MASRAGNRERARQRHAHCCRARLRPAANRGAWIQAYGDNSRTRGDGNAPAYDLSGGSLALGIDRPLENGWRVGAALAYGQQRFFTDAASGTTDGAAAAVYGNYTTGPWAVKLLASAGQTHNRSDRSVVLGATSRTASASFNGTQQSLYAESGYTMTLHEVDVQPVAALAYTHLHNPTYTESGVDISRDGAQLGLRLAKISAAKDRKFNATSRCIPSFSVAVNPGIRAEEPHPPPACPLLESEPTRTTGITARENSEVYGILYDGINLGENGLVGVCGLFFWLRRIAPDTRVDQANYGTGRKWGGPWIKYYNAPDRETGYAWSNRRDSAKFSA